MTLLIIRHGIAMDRDEFAKTCPDDGLRPLTKEGRKKMRQAAAGLKSIIKAIDVLVSSPLTRAVETAEIVGEVFRVKASERAELVPSRRPAGLLEWLRRQPTDATVAIVGHEPHLGLCASWLLTGLEESHVEFKKGGVCRIDFPDKVAAGHGVLRWHLAPAHLRKLA